MCIDTVEIWFTNKANWVKFWQSYLPETRPYFRLRTQTLISQGILTKVGTCIDIKENRFGIANGQISPILAELSARDMITAGYYHFTFLLFICKSISSQSRYLALPGTRAQRCETQQNDILDKKNSDIFHISAQNIDCGYSFELPLYDYEKKIKKIVYTPVNPSFTTRVSQ